MYRNKSIQEKLMFIFSAENLSQTLMGWEAKTGSHPYPHLPPSAQYIQLTDLANENIGYKVKFALQMNNK